MQITNSLTCRLKKADNHALMYTDLSGATRLAGKQARKCTDFYLPKKFD